MKKLKGALIGCGFFAENHILAWKELKNVEIISVCAVSYTHLTLPTNSGV